MDVHLAGLTFINTRTKSLPKVTKCRGMDPADLNLTSKFGTLDSLIIWVIQSSIQCKKVFANFVNLRLKGNDPRK